MLANPQLRSFLPGHDDGPNGLAETALKWLESWNRMCPVIVEAVATDQSDTGKAMELARARMRQPNSSYARAAFSSGYRSASCAPPPARSAMRAKAC